MLRSVERKMIWICNLLDY